MKYNEELYDLSKSIEPTNTKKMSERDIALYQARLLKLIVEEVKFVKKHQAFIHDGCVRISFLKEPYCTAEPDYYKKINEELGMQRKLTNDKGEN